MQANPRGRPLRWGLGVIAAVLAITPFLACGRRSRPRPQSPRTEAAAPSPPVPEEFSTDPRLEAARQALRKQDFRAAMKACDEARRNGAPLAEVAATRSQIFRGADYLDREMEALKQWQQAAPTDFRPTLRLFYIYLSLGWRHDAVKASDRLMKIAPHHPRCLQARAMIHYRSNEPHRALKYIEEARRLDPANLQLVNLHATILIKARKPAQAEAVIRQLTDRGAPTTSDRLLLVQTLLMQRRNKEVEAMLRDMLAKEPDNLEVLYQLGAVLHRQRRHAEAAPLLEQVAERNAQYSKVLWFLGQNYLQTGRREEGLRLMRMFREMDANHEAYMTTLLRIEAFPTNPDLHYRKAQFHLAEESELPEAIVELRRVLELRPGDVRARRDLADALKRSGRLTEYRRLAAAVPPSTTPR